MTVKKLIEKLQELDPEAYVESQLWDTDNPEDFYSVNTVEVSNHGNVRIYHS